MKKTTKWLALLLAGLTSLSLLLSCTQSDEPTGDNTNDPNHNNATDPFAVYEDLSPEEVYQALFITSEVRLSIESEGRTGGNSGKTVRTATKEDHKLELYSASLYNGDTYESTQYADLDAHKSYTELEGNKWWVSDLSDEDTWESLIISLTTGFELLFEDDHYTAGINRYDMTDAALAQMVDESEGYFEQTFGEDYSLKIYMTSDDSTYTFTCRASSADGESYTTTKVLVSFVDVSVTLPSGDSVVSGQPGGAEEDDPPALNPPPDDPDHPDDPDYPDDPEQDPSVPPVVVEPDWLTPSAFYEELIRDDHLTIELVHTDPDGNHTLGEFVRDGQLVSSILLDGNRMPISSIYYDLDRQLQYLSGEEGWYSEALESGTTWRDMVGQLNALCDGLLTLDDTLYVYDSEFDIYHLSDDAAERQGVDWANFSYDDEIDCYTYNYGYSNGYTVEFSVFFRDAVEITLPTIEA